MREGGGRTGEFLILNVSRLDEDYIYTILSVPSIPCFDGDDSIYCTHSDNYMSLGTNICIYSFFNYSHTFVRGFQKTNEN